MPILMGAPCAHALRRNTGTERVAPPTAATFRNSRRFMIGLLARACRKRPDYSLDPGQKGVRKEYFGESKPASTLIQISRFAIEGC
jgi:hypothetical protein